MIWPWRFLQLQKVIPKRKNIHLLIKLEDRPDQYQQIFTLSNNSIL
jgi:hypothetical protein